MGLTAHLGRAGEESIHNESVNNLQGIPDQSIAFLEGHSTKLDAIQPDHHKSAYCSALLTFKRMGVFSYSEKKLFTMSFALSSTPFN